MSLKDPRRRAVMEASSGHAHADTYPNDKKCALVLGITRYSANRYKRNGGLVNAFVKYFEGAPDRFRVQAHFESRMIQMDIKGLTKADLIALYHETLQTEPQVESDDRTLDVSVGACWLNRARASERDSAINAEKAAIEREFAARGITEDEVRG